MPPRRRRAWPLVLLVLVVAALVVSALWPRSDGNGDPGPTDPTEEPPPEEPPPGEEPPTEEPPVEEPPPEEPTLPPDGSVTLADLGLAAIVVDDDGTIRIVSPDRDERVVTDDVEVPRDVRVVPDGQGGVAWQELDNTADVWHADAAGEPSVLLSPAEGELLALVGADPTGDGVLILRTRGSTPDDMTGDLLSVPLDGSEPAVVRDAITAWESGLKSAAVSNDTLLYSLTDAAFEGAFVWPAGGEPVALLEGGEMTGEYTRGVGIPDATTGVVLVETAAGFPDEVGARLLLVDLAAGEVLDEVEVPLQLGAEDSWHVPRDASVVGSLVLVNRYAEGTWLAPLVHDLASGNWAVLEGVGGRTFPTTLADAQ